MKVRPLHDRVVVKRIDAEEKTRGGIIIPDTAKEKPVEGEVLAVGPGARDETGKLVPLGVNNGRSSAVRKMGRHRCHHRGRGPPHPEGVRHFWSYRRENRGQGESSLSPR